MKILLIIVGVVLAMVAVGFVVTNSSTTETRLGNTSTSTATSTSVSTSTVPVTTMGVSITPVSHATAVLGWGSEIIYTDPVGGVEVFNGEPRPTLILLTDIHSDHLSTSTLVSLVNDNVQVIAPQAVADLLPVSVLERTFVLENGATTTIRGFSIEAIAMYNLPETADSRHMKGRGNGYVVERNGTRVYIAGDTSDIPEMRELEDIDIAFIPMNLPFTMSVETAADAVLAFAPKVVYPYHYRGQDGLSDVAKFKQLVNADNPDIDVVLADWYPMNAQ